MQIERDELHALEKSEAVARAGFDAARNREMQLETELIELEYLAKAASNEELKAHVEQLTKRKMSLELLLTTERCV